MIYSKHRVAWTFFFQAEDGIRDLVRSRGLGDVYKRQGQPIVDDFGAAALFPVRDAFMDGAYFIYGHTVMELSLIHI